ncbi:FtsX-like permease family protein [Mycobacterium hodleri]|uniref:ABC transporter permease n=1 Tax=Mycolicibacterium hodleri TaxID=49897 RepID=UPI0021F3C2AD|nr:ABC transporter permease [Mycolicibacterium hodleri]MCV7131882.1 FtsX-like permease family protein [Mycolicibacterium hodleri]
MIATWTLGLLRRRRGRLAATAAGIAAAVALLACLGSFLAAAQGSMTARATGSVSVDWQVEAQPNAQPSAVLTTVASAPGVLAALSVGFAHSTGLTAQTGGSTQTTGPAMVLGVPPNYRQQFPDVMRTLVGADTGVLLAQQTAANLHVAPGDTVSIGRAGLAPVDLVIGGVVDLPQADSLFQNVGAPVGTQPAAPPDNVLILSQVQWHSVFDPLTATRPDLADTQIHTALDHALPPDPGSAYTQVSAAAHNLEARSAGAARVGDNLGAALDAARGDAAYARVLFLFLGLPAAVLAALLTATVVTAGADRRRRDQALLRARGASQAQLIRLAAAEALVVGSIGSAVGLAAAALVGLAAFGSPSLGTDTSTAIGWAAGSAGVGLAIAAVTVLTPAWRDLREGTVATARAGLRRTQPPRWTRYGIDIVVLAASGALFWLTGRGGYQIVLAPEGVPAISVSYWAFVSPALLWIGAALLAWRLADLLLGRGWPVVARALRPVAGSLSRIVAHSLSRQRAPLARAVVLLALALAFAASTATFNATYQAQADVDAQLTNGADVTVTQPPGTAVGPGAGAALAAIPGVRAVEPLQHRFAYIGADLQDLYGVNPTSITQVTALQDNYFHGGTVAQLMHQLATQPDSLLVSEETVTDFQLQPGDTVNLRLPDARTHQLTTVGFHYIGVVTEFPTAPKDSFFVANAAYVAQHTGSDAIGAFLVDTGGRNTTAVANQIHITVGTAATVTDIAATRNRVGSSLTAVNLAGLTRIELGFGLVLAAASGALVLALGLTERRRSFVIAKALGATRRHLRSFVLAEAAILIACGLTAGAVLGWALSHMLVTVLTGVFDPPPSGLTAPWSYLTATAAAIILAIGVASATTIRLARRSPPTLLGEL